MSSKTSIINKKEKAIEMKIAKYQIQRDKEAAQEERLKRYAIGRKKDRQKQKEAKRKKRQKLKYTDMPSFNKYYEISKGSYEVRDKTLFKAKSHNKDRQIEQYIKHVYFKYEAPIYIVSEFQKNLKKYATDKVEMNKIKTIFEGISFLDLFATISQGKSLNKLLKNYMTKKEVHIFLNSKEEEIEKAAISAKLNFLGANCRLKDFLINSHTFTKELTKRNIELMKFIVKNQDDIQISELSQMLDYINNTVNNETNLKEFYSKSIKNMLKASEDWHIEQIFINKIHGTTWLQTFDKYEETTASDIKYVIDEITTAKRLSEEGRKMKHCVSSYADSCARGRSSILSLRADGMNLLTIEVSTKNKKVVQAKGHCNREATHHELAIINRFADKNNLRVDKYL